MSTKLEFTEYRHGRYTAKPGSMFWPAIEEVLSVMTGDTVFTFNDTAVNVYMGSVAADIAEKWDLKREIARLKDKACTV